MASIRNSTIVRTEFHVVTTRGVIARSFDKLDLASEFQMLNPEWRIMEVVTTSRDVTPVLLQSIKVA
jgi:hypothetical protein